MDTDLHSHAAAVDWWGWGAGDCIIRSGGHLGQYIMTVVRWLTACLDVWLCEMGYEFEWLGSNGVR